MILGNSPALQMVSLDLLRGFYTLGVNRILRSYLDPTVVMVTDHQLIPQEVESLAAFATGERRLLLWDDHRLDTSRFPVSHLSRFSLRRNVKIEKWEWPSDLGEPMICCGTSAAYAMQVALLLGANPIGILGIDFNAPQLRAERKPTHCFGDGLKVGATGAGSFKYPYKRIFQMAQEAAAKAGQTLWNLTPYEDSPFCESGIPRCSLATFAHTYAASAR